MPRCPGVRCSGRGTPIYHVQQQDCPECDESGHHDPGADLCLACVPTAVDLLLQHDYGQEWPHQHPVQIMLNNDLL